MTINVVIVNYRTASLAIKCIRSLLEQRVCGESSIILVDNDSGDQSPDVIEKAFPGIKIVRLDDNRGYSAGVNAGVTCCEYDFVLVLNPDTYFFANPIPTILEYMGANPRVGLVGLDLRNPDMTRQFPSRRFYTVFDILVRRVPLLAKRYAKKVDAHLMTKAWEGTKEFDVDWVMGTGFVVRTQMFKDVGWMDEGYFLYMEDVDLCARFWVWGYEVKCIPDAAIIHDHQRSSAQRLFSTSARHHYRSLMRYYRRFPLPLYKTPTVNEMRRKFERTVEPVKMKQVVTDKDHKL